LWKSIEIDSTDWISERKMVKSQYSNDKFQINNNDQIPNIKQGRPSFPFGISALRLGVYLEFGSCDLLFLEPSFNA
jgi:hypothetical protein